MAEASAPVFLERTSRATRGQRMTKLLDDEQEADEEFWGQEALAEGGEDVEYEAEEDVVDEFDSDFDEDDANAEEEDIAEDDFERVKKKRLLPPGTKPIRKDKRTTTASKTKGLDVIEAAVAAAIQSKAGDEPDLAQAPSKQLQEDADFEGFLDFEGEKTVRKSTRTAVVIRQAEREALRAAMEATTIKPVKRKREGERRITQEDMLLEAAQTEILNRQHLERMLAREEEVKQKAIVHKTVYSGPQIRFYSRDGKNLVEFIGDVAESQELFGQQKPSYKRSLVCAVTGLPAKYIDPLTGLPYATKEAFKMIRERVYEDDSIWRERTPSKNLRSPRMVSGRLTARKAKRSISQGSLHGKLSIVERRAVASMREEAERPHFGEASPTEKDMMGLTPQPSSHDISPQRPTEARAAAESFLERPRSLESRFNSIHWPDMSASSAPTPSGPQWVEIPPPKQESIEDDFLLEDLTNLNFGPILASQHGLNTLFVDLEDELDIGDTMLPLDVLPMPPEFGTNISVL